MARTAQQTGQTLRLPSKSDCPGTAIYWKRYIALQTAAQLICRRFRYEFSPAWAGTTIFELYNPPPWGSHPPDLHSFWFRVRNFLEYIGPLAGRHVRLVRICDESYVLPDPRSILPAAYRKLLQPVTGLHLQRHFERIDDVHPHLKIEIEIISMEHCNYYNAAKRVFTLQQRAFEEVRRGGGQDWECSVGPLLLWKLDHTVCRHPGPDCQEHTQTTEYHGLKSHTWMSWQTASPKEENEYQE